MCQSKYKVKNKFIPVLTTIAIALLSGIIIIILFQSRFVNINFSSPSDIIRVLITFG